MNLWRKFSENETVKVYMKKNSNCSDHVFNQKQQDIGDCFVRIKLGNGTRHYYPEEVISICIETNEQKRIYF